MEDEACGYDPDLEAAIQASLEPSQVQCLSCLCMLSLSVYLCFAIRCWLQMMKAEYNDVKVIPFFQLSPQWVPFTSQLKEEIVSVDLVEESPHKVTLCSFSYLFSIAGLEYF